MSMMGALYLLTDIVSGWTECKKAKDVEEAKAFPVNIFFCDNEEGKAKIMFRRIFVP